VTVERELDELYAADLGEFTRARNELVKRLRKEGAGDEAAHVAGLKKPTAAVWAANQLAREARKEVDAMLDAGHRVREAQRKALAKGDPRELERAQQAQNASVRGLLGRAREILRERHGSASDATIDRLGATLRAASVDEDGRELLARGRLTEELEPAGFEALASMAALLEKSPKARQSAAAKQERDRVADLREGVRDAKARESELRVAARDAQRTADRARKEAERLQAAADRAAERAEAAAGEVEEAEARLAEAQKRR
jgi:hypothetical protein